MRYLLNLVLFLRLRQKFWGDLFMWWHHRQVSKVIGDIKFDLSNIRFIVNKP